jgi:multicomponent Na+:H+ antiporter subunit D
VASHERTLGRHHYFFILLSILHGCLNACFISNDLFNLYVTIELASIIAFLMLAQGLGTGHIWNALRYLFISNVAMLFFLLGALLVYESTGSFGLANVGASPPTARALIVGGLLVKGGVFLPGLWLPQAHAEALGAVSAMLSGVVIKAGLLPLIRLEMYSPDLDIIIRSLGFGGVFLGLGLAFFQQDIKRLLACSSVSQAGFILIAPEVGCAYAFSHGIAKVILFLCAGRLPTRDLATLRQTGVVRSMAWPMKIAALSIAGVPLLLGFHAKYQVSEAVSGSLGILVIIASIGTAILLSPILLLRSNASPWRGPGIRLEPACLAGVILLAGLVLGPWKGLTVVKGLATIGAGLLLHKLLFVRLMKVAIPNGWEKLEHVVGMTCLVLVLITIAVYVP